MQNLTRIETDDNDFEIQLAFNPHSATILHYDIYRNRVSERALHKSL
jgi:hypothetical protein